MPVSNFCALLGWPMTPESAFHQESCGVLDGIVALAEEACEVQSAPDAGRHVRQGDTSWCTRRNGEQARNVILAQTPDPNHPVNGKPIAFVVVRRTVSLIQGNFIGSSQAMESESLDRCLEILEIDGKQCRGSSVSCTIEAQAR
jgi:hypothetical protein